MREYFCAYHSMLDATRKLSDAECGRLFRSLLAYSQYRTKPINLQGREEIVFDIYSQQIDREIEKYDQACKRNRRNVTTRYDSLPLVTSRNDSLPVVTSRNDSLPVVTTRYDPLQGEDKDKGKDKGKGKGKGESGRASRFTPPALEDVQAYAREMGWPDWQFSAQRFVDFYASKGWRVGKEPMKDWRAAARGWVSRQEQPAAGRGGAARANPATEYLQREYRDEDFEDGFFAKLDNGEAT